MPCIAVPTQSFLRILQLLDRHGVEYVVVGGVAAVLQGAPVTTFDIDALVKVDATNADRLLAALQSLDARYREHDSLQPTRDDLLAGGHLLLMTNSGPLDVLGFIGGGKRYEDVTDATATIAVGDLAVRVLGIEALIEEKKGLGRDKDVATVRLLETVLRRRS
jgi:hypothetical protein